jgi:hypothetical protein
MTEAPDEYDDDRPDRGDDAPDEAPDDVLRTGDPGVDEVLAGMHALHRLPVDEHAAVFEDAHDSLRKALDPDRESA